MSALGHKQTGLMTHACTSRCAIECLVMLIAAFIILGIAVLLGACGSAFANGEQHAGVVARGPARVPSRRRPKLSRSRTGRPAEGARSGCGFLRHRCHVTDNAGSIDWRRAAFETYLQDPDLGDDDRYPRYLCCKRLRHSHRLRPFGIERRLSTATSLTKSVARHVRFVPIADMRASPCNVCFTPKSGLRNQLH